LPSVPTRMVTVSAPNLVYDVSATDRKEYEMEDVSVHSLVQLCVVAVHTSALRGRHCLFCGARRS
jgi:hypothetical protein